MELACGLGFSPTLGDRPARLERPLERPLQRPTRQATHRQATVVAAAGRGGSGASSGSGASGREREKHWLLNALGSSAERAGSEYGEVRLQPAAAAPVMAPPLAAAADGRAFCAARLTPMPCLLPPANRRALFSSGYPASTSTWMWTR